MTELEVEKSHEEHFRAALEHVETAAGTPVVSGEMVGWLGELQQACDDLRVTLDRQLRRAHAPQFAAIKGEDLEMARHVEQMQQEDREIAQAMQGAIARLDVLKPMAERIEPDEKRAEAALLEFGEQAAQLVMRIRKQEVTMRTWFQEAFTRDRGVVD